MIVAICSHDRPFPEVHGLKIMRYKKPDPLSSQYPFGTQLWHESLLRSELVGKLALKLISEGWHPDCILGHSGWGETLAIKEIWPRVRLIIWPELWLRPRHMGFGSDPNMGAETIEQSLTNIGRNSLTEASLSQASAWVLPTRHQASSFPLFIRTLECT